MQQLFKLHTWILFNRPTISGVYTCSARTQKVDYLGIAAPVFFTGRVTNPQCQSTVGKLLDYNKCSQLLCNSCIISNIKGVGFYERINAKVYINFSDLYES